MDDLRTRLFALFAGVGFIVALGRFENNDVETFVLTDTNLILRQDAVLEEAFPTDLIAQEPAVPQAENSSVSREDNVGRTPASLAAWNAPKLGRKRKPKVLIAAVDSPPSTDISRDQQTVRLREVSVDGMSVTSLLATLPKDASALAGLITEERTLEFDLFEDTQLEAVVDGVHESSGGGFVARGHLGGREGGRFHLVSESGVTVANFSIGNTTGYELRFNGKTHVVLQTDASKYGPDLPYYGGPQAEVIAKSSASAAAEGAALSGKSPGDVTEIDVLIAYTPQAAAANGGPAAMSALAQLGVDEANADFRQGLVGVRVRLAGMMQLESNEAQSADVALTSLADDSDGTWDEVHAKRAETGADLVHVLTGSPGSGACGTGFLNSDRETAFSLSSVSCLSNHSLTRELALNLGASSELPFSTDSAAMLNKNKFTVGKFESTPAAAVPVPTVTAPPHPDVSCSIRVGYPNGGETLSQSIGERLAWTSNQVDGSSVRIKLLNGERDLGTLSRERDTGSTLVRIPALVEPGSDYRIRVESISEPGCFDESDASFTVAP